VRSEASGQIEPGQRDAAALRLDLQDADLSFEAIRGRLRQAIAHELQELDHVLRGACHPELRHRAVDRTVAERRNGLRHVVEREVLNHMIRPPAGKGLVDDAGPERHAGAERSRNLTGTGTERLHTVDFGHFH
jgi:hypothetical protein